MYKRIPYHTILAAVAGDGEALETIIRHYKNYISYHAQRGQVDEMGNYVVRVNLDIQELVEAKLRYAIVCKFDPTKLPDGETLEP